jgi:hypothetical protein
LIGDHSIDCGWASAQRSLISSAGRVRPPDPLLAVSRFTERELSIGR